MKYFFAVLIGSLAWLDRVFIFQAMISRPIVISIIMGAFLGDIRTAMICGAALELLWLNTPPVGSFLPQDESFCCAAVTPAAIVAAQWVDPAVAAGFALALGLPTASVGRRLDVFIREKNGDLSGLAVSNMADHVRSSVLRALMRAFFLVALLLGTCFALLAGAAWLMLPLLPEKIITAFGYIPLLSIIIGVASILGQGRRLTYELGIFAAGMACVLLWISFA